MAASSSRDNPSPPAGKGVRFADASAEALLRSKLAQLYSPGQGDWLQVKHNASRTVYRGRIDGREMYLKHFHDRSLGARLGRSLHLSGALREQELSRRLAEAGAAAAPVLAAACDAAGEWVLTEAVSPGTTLEAWHAERLARGAASRAEVARMSRRLARLLAAAHAAGVVHRDLHCGNVVIGPGGRCVLMDLHRALRKRRVSRRLRAINLAQLCHDRTPATTRSQRLRFLKHYLRFSGAGGSLRGWEMLVSFHAHRHTRRQLAQRDRRIFRCNKYFSPIALPGRWRGHVVLASKRRPEYSRAAKMSFTGEQWRRALGDVDGLLSGPEATVVKDTAGGLVVRRDLAVGEGAVRVFIKRPRRRGLGKLLGWVRPHRPRRAFALGHKLLARRLATALPLAMLERRRGPFVLDSVLITEAVDGPMVWQYLTEALAPPGTGERGAALALRRRRGRRLLWSLGRVVRVLHQGGFSHRDLKTVNILMHPGPRGPEPVFIDLDGLSRPLALTLRRRLRDLARMVRALLIAPPHASAPGRLRVLLGYLAPPGGGPVNFKVYWRVLEQLGATGPAGRPRGGQGGGQ